MTTHTGVKPTVKHCKSAQTFIGKRRVKRMQDVIVLSDHQRRETNTYRSTSFCSKCKYESTVCFRSEPSQLLILA
ncbi:hypothetical protein ACROYT_G018701 [Oculina patagonica]